METAAAFSRWEGVGQTPDIDISGLPLLKGVERGRLDWLLQGARVRECEKDVRLFSEGEAADRLYILLAGAVELFTSAEGRDAVLLILWPPETFLPAAALTDEPYLLTARTLSPSRLLALDADRVRAAARDDPILAHRISDILAAHFRIAIRHIKDLKLRNAPQRLGAFLLRLIDETGDEGCVDLPLTKATIASRLDLSAETLSRALHVLRDHGLAVHGSRLVLHDRNRFERFCVPDPLIDGPEAELPVAAL